MIKKYFSLLLFLSFLSCENNQNNAPLPPIAGFEKYKNVKTFDEMFVLEKTFELKTDDPAILGGMMILSINKDNKIVCSMMGGSPKLFIFDSTGNTIADVGKKGEAPGEFNCITGVAANDKNIFLFDPTLQRMNLFDYDGKFVFSFKVKGLFTAISADDNNLYLKKQTMENGKYENDEIYTYNVSGNYLGSIKLPVDIKTERYKMFGSSISGLIKKENRLYNISTSEDFSINCYDLDKNEIIWATNYLPEWVKIEKKIPSNNKDEWYKKNSIFSSFNIYENGLIQLKIDDGLIFYDPNGNYLTDLKDKESGTIAVKNNKLFKISCSLGNAAKNDFKVFVKVYKLKV